MSQVEAQTRLKSKALLAVTCVFRVVVRRLQMPLLHHARLRSIATRNRDAKPGVKCLNSTTTSCKFEDG